MDRTEAPTEDRIATLRQSGTVPYSASAPSVMGGAAALIGLIVVCEIAPLTHFFTQCRGIDEGCRGALQDLLEYGVRAALIPAALYVLAAACTTAALNRFYFRVGISVPPRRSAIRSVLRTFVLAGIGIVTVGVIVPRLFPALFGLFNTLDTSGYDVFYGGLMQFAKSVGSLWIGTAVLSAIAIGFFAWMSFRYQHAMSKEEIARENRG